MHKNSAHSLAIPNGFGLIVIGDEILSGKRTDKHAPKLIELLAARGLQLDWVAIVGDSPLRITETLRRAFSSGDIVFSCGGIGATPDDHTRQCAANALGVGMALHPEAERLIRQRMQVVAKESGLPFNPQHPDNVHRLNMGVFPVGANTIPNPYNQIAGFSCQGAGAGHVYFFPGFPIMAAPMMEWVLDSNYAHLFKQNAIAEKSIIVYGALEAALTPLMLNIERDFSPIKVFSLPSVDHPEHGRHIELGVKGAPDDIDQAYTALLQGLHDFGANLGPEMVR